MAAVMYEAIEKDKALITKASQQFSTASFKKIWDNEEDAAYDKL